MSIPDEVRRDAAKIFGAPVNEIVWIEAVCDICAANVYTVNMEAHTKWHEARWPATRP